MTLDKLVCEAVCGSVLMASTTIMRKKLYIYEMVKKMNERNKLSNLHSIIIPVLGNSNMI